VIAIAGKGGTGKTTLAALLVRGLLERSLGPLLAIDADPNDNLAEALGMQRCGSIAEVADEFFADRAAIPAGMSKEALLELRLNAAISEGRGLDLLVMGHPEGPGCYCYVNNVLRAQLEKLEGNYPFVVMDNAAGMEHLSRRTARRIDTLLLVADPTVRALRAARRIRGLVEELGLRVRQTGLVLNRVRGDVAALGPEIAAVGARLWQAVPESAAVLDNDLRGGAASGLPADDPAVVAAGRLVDMLVADVAV